MYEKWPKDLCSQEKKDKFKTTLDLISTAKGQNSYSFHVQKEIHVLSNLYDQSFTHTITILWCLGIADSPTMEILWGHRDRPPVIDGAVTPHVPPLGGLWVRVRPSLAAIAIHVHYMVVTIRVS